MLNAELDTDILIAGAGPAGLFLANECARRGLRWRIAEARPALVRPDGYVAYAAHNGDRLKALESARPILELQTG